MGQGLRRLEFDLQRGRAAAHEREKNPTELYQMKSQLGQRVVGTAQRIPPTWSKHTSRDRIVWDREEKECRVVGFSKGGIFHLYQPPLDAPAAPARLSRTLYAAATPPPCRSQLWRGVYRVYVIVLPCSRSRRKKGMRAEKWHDIARKSFYGVKVSNAPILINNESCLLLRLTKSLNIFITFLHRSYNL